MADLPEAVAELRRQWGLDFARVRRVLTALADGATVGQLVAASGLPRRDVESILAELAQFAKRDGDRHHLPDPGPLEGTPPAVQNEAALTEHMAELAAQLPPSRWRLDHVPATPETMARRALYLAGEYALDGASVLCLGDHDLTSLAVGAAEPGAGLTVVDIDERILDRVVVSAGQLGFPVTAAWADLRLALPPSLVASADLVFTDPPYTTDGMRLFLVRALEALRPTGHERLAFCFGTGERHLVKALEVQSLLGDLRLVLEAMLPGFNRYDGAEAIGARSDLYICRPTKGARVGEPARPARSKRTDTRIYTRGPAAQEASARTLPDAVATAALKAAGDGPLILIGDGWPPDAGAGVGDRAVVGDGGTSADGRAEGDEPKSRRRVGLADFFGGVAAWATAARPGPFPFSGTPVVNTDPDHGGAALRTLLLTAPARAVLIGPRRDLVAAALLPPTTPDADPLVRLLAAAYDLSAVPTGPGGDPAVVVATRHDRAPADAAEAVLRHVVLHPGAKVVNAWRDGLLSLARAAGTTMTKNEARARIDIESLPPALARLRLWELPVSALQSLVREVARTTGP
jgi:hypothetical protein